MRLVPKVAICNQSTTLPLPTPNLQKNLFLELPKAVRSTGQAVGGPQWPGQAWGGLGTSEQFSETHASQGQGVDRDPQGAGTMSQPRLPHPLLQCLWQFVCTVELGHRLGSQPPPLFLEFWLERILVLATAGYFSCCSS